MLKLELLHTSPRTHLKSRLKRRQSINSNRPSRRRVLLFGSAKSGKKSVIEYIDKLAAPVDIIPLSNEIPPVTYSNFLQDADCVICVLDSTKIDQLSYLQQMQETLLRLGSHNHYESKKLLILLNKHDILPLPSTRMVENRMRLQSLEMDWLVLPSCSVDRRYGISEGVNWLLA